MHPDSLELDAKPPSRPWLLRYDAVFLVNPRSPDRKALSGPGRIRWHTNSRRFEDGEAWVDETYIDYVADVTADGVDGGEDALAASSCRPRRACRWSPRPDPTSTCSSRCRRWWGLSGLRAAYVVGDVDPYRAPASRRGPCPRPRSRRVASGRSPTTTPTTGRRSRRGMRRARGAGRCRRPLRRCRPLRSRTGCANFFRVDPPAGDQAPPTS